MISNIFKGGLALSLGMTALALLPAAYVELGCRGTVGTQQEPRFIANEDWPVSEREVILSIPRHHMAFSYEDLSAAVLEGGAHRFGFVQSVRSYWSSLCDVMPVAEQVAETSKSERISLYASGVAFSFDMATKGAYEETIGRLTSVFSQNKVTSVEKYEADVYRLIGSHLHDRPWWEVDWMTHANQIVSLEGDNLIRDGERQGALWAFWKTKGFVASKIATAGTKPPERTALHVSWLTQEALAEVSNLRVDQPSGQGYALTMLRGSDFTPGVIRMLEQGALISEVSGADDVMLTVLSDAKPITPNGTIVLSTIKRPGFDRDRFVLRARTRSLARLIETLEAGGDEIEMIVDF